MVMKTGLQLVQEEIERENAKIHHEHREGIRDKLDSVSIEFEVEIALLRDMIVKWRKEDHAPRGPGATPERKAYRNMIDKISSWDLSEAVIRGIFEASLTMDQAQPVTYPAVVNNQLIQRKLKSLLPREEAAIPVEHKFASIDLLVSRAVRFLPSLFIDVPSRKVKTPDTIELTQSAEERLGKVDISHLLTDVPMRCPPQAWTSVFHGGFLTPEMQRGNPLIGSRYHDYKELLAIDKSLQENPGVLEAVNKMQSVAFKVDQQYAHYQKVIDEARHSKIIESQNKLASLNKEIQELEEALKLELETV